jgi:hypothetical protein
MTVIHGELISSPYKKTTVFFNYEDDPLVKEKIEIEIAGTPAEIQTALATLQLIKFRSDLYSEDKYSKPQIIRFQQAHGDYTLSANIYNINISTLPNGYNTWRRGSILVILTYYREPWFDKGLYVLKLSSPSASDVVANISLFNHDDGSSNFNSVYAKHTDIDTVLPAPARLEISLDTVGASLLDLFVGFYNNVGADLGYSHFYLNYDAWTGGSTTYNTNAIANYYRTVTWSANTYTQLAIATLSAATLDKLDFKSYRPILHLYSNLGNTDTYYKLFIKSGSDVLYETDAVYGNTGYRYIVFPSLDLPLKELVRSTDPDTLDIAIYGYKDNTSSRSLNFDQLLLLPLDYSVYFSGFSSMVNGDALIYDASTYKCSTRKTSTFKEIKQHVVMGSGLKFPQGNTTRMIFVWSNSSRIISIDDKIKVTAYYRKRFKIL